MAIFPDGIEKADSLKSTFTKKNLAYDKCTAKGSNDNALALRVKALESEGWEQKKQNKRSVQMVRPKPEDRRLEDDVWCMFYQLGFHELNIDRNLNFVIAPDVPGRQIDQFAKDDETVFLVECRHAKSKGKKSIKDLLEKITSYREQISKQIRSHYGAKRKLKVKWGVALKNIDVNLADRKLLESKGIALITDEDIEYFSNLSKLLKGAARYQFLAYYLSGEKVEALKLEVPATEGKMGGRRFYNFLISPQHLIKIAYVSHKAASSQKTENTYQRIIKTARLKNIAEYIDRGGQFPTNIVINICLTSAPLGHIEVFS